MMAAKRVTTETRLKTLQGVHMNGTENGVNELTAEELEELLNSEFGQATPPAEENNNSNGNNEGTEGANKNSNVENTKAFAARLKESTDKVRREERENIAKSLGYESYDAMLKEKENKILKDGGFNPEDVSPVVDQIVNERLKNDPRLVELEELKKVRAREFAKEELAKITELTGGEITELKQLSPEVIELWKKKGSLKAAFMEVEGEKLITKIRSGQSKGSTDHLANPSGSNPGKTTKRHLTADEKARWKFFNPNMSDEELDKKLIDA